MALYGTGNVSHVKGVDPGGPVVIILACGSEVCGFEGVKVLSMTSFGRKVKSWVRVVDLRHVKEPQAEIRASEQNLWDFSRSMSEATLMT